MVYDRDKYTMKTYYLDSKAISDIIAKSLSNYPEGSLSPRTIITTLPVGNDPEKTLGLVDFAISKNILKTATSITGPRTKNLSKEEIDELTNKIVSAARSACK